MTAVPEHLVVTADAVGGVWQYTAELSRELSRRDIAVTIALLGPAPSSEQRRDLPENAELVETGCDMDWVAESPEQMTAAGREIAAIAKACKADLVQLNAPALGARAEFPAPVVAVQHSCLATWWDAVKDGPMLPEFAWRSDDTREGLKRADAVVAPTASFAAATQRIHGLKRLPRAVHNGRTPFPLAPRPRETFALAAGRLWDAGKNVETLDRAARQCGVPIRAAGPLRSSHHEWKRFDHVDCLGELTAEELAAQLAARPIFVSPARYEPFGLAVLEAAQAGCALVLSDIPTFRELWGGAAVFVPSEDAAGWAAALDMLAEDEPVRRALEEAAQARSQRFTPARMAGEMLKVYNRALAPERAAA